MLQSLVSREKQTRQSVPTWSRGMMRRCVSACGDVQLIYVRDNRGEEGEANRS